MVSILDLSRNALRVRPDRIIVGDIGASESMDMLQAMNRGQDGPRDALPPREPAR